MRVLKRLYSGLSLVKLDLFWPAECFELALVPLYNHKHVRSAVELTLTRLRWVGSTMGKLAKPFLPSWIEVILVMLPYNISCEEGRGEGGGERGGGSEGRGWLVSEKIYTYYYSVCLRKEL